MRRPTLSDVAKHAGVGKVTVSYVLNGQSRTARISAETEKRVLRSAQELQYRPNGVARMLVTQRSNSLAVVFQYADLFASGSGFINEVMRGVCSASVEEGYDLMLHTRLESTLEQEVDVLSDGRADGALILRDEGDATVQALFDRGFPTVLFFTRSSHADAAWVDADNYAGARMAVEHLLELGHRKIGMVGGPDASVAARDRRRGYVDALVAAGHLPTDSLYTKCGTKAEVEIQLPRLLKLRPTALFVWSDDVAVSCMDLCRQLEISIPDQLSIIGFDSLDICNRTVPQLSSVRQPIFDMAAEATRLLARITRKEEVPQRQILFPLSLDLRGSTAPAPTIH